MAGKTVGKWSDKQLKYIQFLARGKKNLKGERRTKEQFAAAIGVHWTRLYEWQKMPGFKYALLEATIAVHADDLPEMIQSHVAEAKGIERFYTYKDPKTGKIKRKQYTPNVQSLREILKLSGLMIDRSEVENTGEISHKWGEMPDDELDRAIKARQDRAA